LLLSRFITLPLIEDAATLSRCCLDSSEAANNDDTVDLFECGMAFEPEELLDEYELAVEFDCSLSFI
jgi:hypothetical protein